MTYLRVEIASAINHLSYFFFNVFPCSLRSELINLRLPHTLFTHKMEEGKQIFLFFQLLVVFTTCNILVITWWKKDKIKRKCSFCTCKRGYSCQKLVYYSRSSNSRCLASNFPSLVIWHSSEFWQWVYTLNSYFYGRVY